MQYLSIEYRLKSLKMYFWLASCLYPEIVQFICFKDYDDDSEDDDDGDEENEDDNNYDNKPVGNQRSNFLHRNIKCMFVIAIKILSQCFMKHKNMTLVWSFSVGMWLVVKNALFWWTRIFIKTIIVVPFLGGEWKGILLLFFLNFW